MEEKTGKADKKEIRSRKNQKLYRSRFGKGGKIMKKLEIVIRPESLENLELLLEEQKANGMMITNILGYGNQKGYRQMYRGAEIVAKMLPKVKVETVVEDDKVPKIVDFVVKNLSTGNYGDGKIFVYDVEDAARRTGTLKNLKATVSEMTVSEDLQTGTGKMGMRRNLLWKTHRYYSISYGPWSEPFWCILCRPDLPWWRQDLQERKTPETF